MSREWRVSSKIWYERLLIAPDDRDLMSTHTGPHIMTRQVLSSLSIVASAPRLDWIVLAGNGTTFLNGDRLPGWTDMRATGISYAHSSQTTVGGKEDGKTLLFASLGIPRHIASSVARLVQIPVLLLSG